jgi:Putative peptidoglycan binding domain/L,D-transpeptidase catalytic domain
MDALCQPRAQGVQIIPPAPATVAPNVQINRRADEASCPRPLRGPLSSRRSARCGRWTFLALQQRLSSLGYWLGTPDGRFGDGTEQAVYALQKAADITRDGIVGPVTERALAEGIVPHPRSTSGTLIEVDLENDLLMFVQNGRLSFTLDTSTGGGYGYTDDGVTAIADTPVGLFHIYRQVFGTVVDSLGQLWSPKFFNEGFAIHGDIDVPPYPVSHGCVRVSNEAIERIWSSNLAPIGTPVWVY